MSRHKQRKCKKLPKKKEKKKTERPYKILKCNSRCLKFYHSSLDMSYCGFFLTSSNVKFMLILTLLIVNIHMRVITSDHWLTVILFLKFGTSNLSLFFVFFNQKAPWIKCDSTRVNLSSMLSVCKTITCVKKFALSVEKLDTYYISLLLW